jgi:predicted N-acetyltransferase YhbS
VSLAIVQLHPTHNLLAFRCRESGFNNYLHNHALQDQRRGNAAIFVLVETTEAHEILGYYTLSPSQISTQGLPLSYRKQIGKNRKFAPVFVLGKLAVSAAHTGKQYGELLIYHALEQVFVRNTMGGTGIVIHALNEKLATYYAALGFVADLDQPLTLYLPRGSSGY